jgi:hypothetical protein
MSNTNQKSGIGSRLLVLVLIPLLLVTAWCGYNVYHISNDRADIKDDFMEANSIVNGMLNLNRWRDELRTIVANQIDSFELTPKQDSLMRVQISDLLHTMLREGQRQVESENGIIDNNLTRFLVSSIADWDKLHASIPDFTEIIMREITKEESKERLRLLALSKFDELAKQVYDDTLDDYLQNIYSSYGQQSLSSFNETVKLKADEMEEEAYTYTYAMLGILVLFLSLWFLAAKFPNLKKPLFVLSVMLAIVILLTGLSSPMIEIDARIASIDFTLLSQHITYQDQMLFYRSKSILQVVWLMFQSTRIDSLLVGFLILAFSVLLPLSKLVSAQFYVLGKPAWRKNKIISWLVYKSGKWSMADVMVVAIFMSYVAFDGILDTQLKLVEFKEEQMTSIATNLTSLQPGFILFIMYVLYGLILAAILKNMLKLEKATT